ncbi:hypothetical protein DFJ77DRAFT_463939 [Powellomyces hirtus]|nr:hypothetical protein DFJ77DRAFT_463939 [Powellomyces hirtus]
MANADWTLILLIIGGVALAFQAGVNGTLGSRGGNAVFATLLSFVSGIIPLAIYWLASTHGGRDTEFKRIYEEAPWYSHFGGLMGAYYVGMIIVLAPRLGAAVILSVAVTTQVLAALIFDHFGALGLEEHKATAGRIVGVILSAVGVALIMELVSPFLNVFRAKKSQQDLEAVEPSVLEAVEPASSPTLSMDEKPGRERNTALSPPSITTFPAAVHETSATSTTTSPKPSGIDFSVAFAGLGGVALALQAAMNGKLGQVGGGGYSAVFSFVLGSVFLAVWYIIDLYWGPTSRQTPKWTIRRCWENTPLWAWPGGILGAAYVLIITIIIPRLGATTVLGVSVCAQVIAAVVLDHFGWVGLDKKRAGVSRIVGMVVVVGGVIMITVL